MVRSRLSATTVVTDEEIDEAIAKLKASVGQTEDLLSEILIPVDSPDQEEPQRQTALKNIEQLHKGASFPALARQFSRSEEHTSELQSLMRISYAVFCLTKK